MIMPTLESFLCDFKEERSTPRFLLKLHDSLNSIFQFINGFYYHKKFKNILVLEHFKRWRLCLFETGCINQQRLLGFT